MKEELYTIPVNDAFQTECECPICAMKDVLEQNAVEYTMGPSYMEDDVRMETDRLGFCQKHMRQVAGQNNKLGLALVVKTHMDKVIKDVEKLSKKREKPKGILKKAPHDPVVEWFINKFDYRYYDEPWKNAKDSLPRALTKLNGIVEKEE